MCSPNHKEGNGKAEATVKIANQEMSTEKPGHLSGIVDCPKHTEEGWFENTPAIVFNALQFTICTRYAGTNITRRCYDEDFAE
jgi:hypothetical protein